MVTNFYDIDFQDLKSSFKTYIKNQAFFQDYNFEGSALNNLLDVFAQAIMYHAFYLNMSTNELFLNTAQLDNSVYKLANMLGYLPRRKKASSIQVTVTNSKGSSVVIPKYSQFSMGQLKLTAMQNYTVATGTSQIYLYDGEWTTKEFTSDGSDFQRYELTDKNYIDNDFFYLFVYPYDADLLTNVTDETIWTQINSSSAFDVGGKNYYIEQLDKFYVRFDNGTMCQKPANLDKVIVSYLKTGGYVNNGNSGNIALVSSFTDSSHLSFATTSALSNGTDEEATEAIRLNAPQFYVSANRAITEDDFNAIIKKYSYYSSLDSAYVWGGQRERVDANGDIIGTGSNFDVGFVYWTALKSDLSHLSDIEKADIETFLEKYKILTLQFKHLSPSIFYIVPDIRIKFTDTFNIDLAAIKQDINTNFLDTKTGFNTRFNLSNLIAYVDDIDKVSRVQVNYNAFLRVKNSARAVARICNRIIPGSINSDTPGGDLTDDGAGNLKWNGATVGSVNYYSGQMIIEKDFGVTSYDVSFSLYDSETFSVSKETYLNYSDYNIIVLAS